ncbi:MAG: sporulation integral membrane protein YtvI, partial [Oscillospiraceae bacterium]|nr:sporulation integral membrane protein YtvI [Oscillospiraceae bacterium]
MSKRASSLVYIALISLALWLFAKFALRWFMPFIAAFLLARAVEPMARWLTDRLRIKRAVASGICAAFVFAALASVASLAVGRAVYELTAAAKGVPKLLAEIPELLAELEERTRGAIGSAPPEARAYITYASEEARRRCAEALGALSKGIISRLSGILSGGHGFLISIFTCAVSTFFISSGYEELSAFVSRQLPKRLLSGLEELKAELRRTLSAWLRAQMILVGITFFELAVLFCALRIDFAILLALAVAVVDLLPALGVGTALIPWGVVELIRGNAPRGIALLASFCVILAARNIIEPKLVGRQIGLPPLATLVSMYVGFCAAGIAGMALLPIGL